jgi:hypothetical protein
MPQSRGLFDYVRAAFNARPFGMFVAPNWVGVAAFGLLGFLNPGFWLLGAGLELGYLTVLSTNGRFQRAVNAADQSGSDQDWQRKISDLLQSLGEGDRRRYNALAARCHGILEQQAQGGGAALDAQSAGLGRLLWMYLRLLVARTAIERVLGDASRSEPLDRRLKELEAQVDAPNINDDLRRSLNSQLDILRQRIAQQADAKEKIQFLDAEIIRIQEQVELIREQAALSTDPERLSERIDQIAATLGGTSQWIRDQQQVYGEMEDLLTEPPRLASSMRIRESQ